MFGDNILDDEKKEGFITFASLADELYGANLMPLATTRPVVKIAIVELLAWRQI